LHSPGHCVGAFPKKGSSFEYSTPLRQVFAALSVSEAADGMLAAALLCGPPSPGQLTADKNASLNGILDLFPTAEPSADLAARPRRLFHLETEPPQVYFLLLTLMSLAIFLLNCS